MNPSSFSRISAVALCWALVNLASNNAHAVVTQWSRILSSPNTDIAADVAADGQGSLYVTGLTTGNLGRPNNLPEDVFLAKYDAAGNLQWTRQTGTDAGWERGLTVSADGLGNAYVGGDQSGSSPLNTSAFVAKYDAAGVLKWTKNFNSVWNDGVTGVSADSLGNVFVAGITEGNLDGTPQVGFDPDAFLAKLDGSGNVAWLRQFGTFNLDGLRGVAVDGLGNVFATGFSSGALGGAHVGQYDAYVCKFDAAGNLVWSAQVGTELTDGGIAVRPDGLGNVFITGFTEGSFAAPHAGNRDVFVSKFDAAGSPLWTKQFGGPGWDEGQDLAVDSTGRAYVVGVTYSSLQGQNAGHSDSFLTTISPTGDLIRTIQFGTNDVDGAYGAWLDGNRDLYVTGGQSGNPSGIYYGGYDAFLIKFEVPEPAPNVMILAVGLFGLATTRGWKGDRSI